MRRIIQLGRAGGHYTEATLSAVVAAPATSTLPWRICTRYALTLLHTGHGARSSYRPPAHLFSWSVPSRPIAVAAVLCSCSAAEAGIVVANEAARWWPVGHHRWRYPVAQSPIHATLSLLAVIKPRICTQQRRLVSITNHKIITRWLYCVEWTQYTLFGSKWSAILAFDDV